MIFACGPPGVVIVRLVSLGYEVWIASFEELDSVCGTPPEGRRHNHRPITLSS
jgi:hypothetical protein